MLFITALIRLTSQFTIYAYTLQDESGSIYKKFSIGCHSIMFRAFVNHFLELISDPTISAIVSPIHDASKVQPMLPITNHSPLLRLN